MPTLPETQNPAGVKKRVRVKKKKPHELEAYGKKIDERKKNGMKKAEIRARGIEVMKLRATGATYQEIADSLGLNSPGHAQRIFNSAIARTEIEAAKDVVALDLLRLDEYQLRCTHALRQNGDLGQIDRLLRIMEFRYRLLGVTEETVRQLQGDHGIHITNKNQVMVVAASPESSQEFIAKMMGAVGVDPNDEKVRRYIEERVRVGDNTALPMLEGSANDSQVVAGSAKVLGEEAIEILEVEEP